MPEYVPIKARKYRYKQFASKYVETGCNGLQTVLQCGFTTNPHSARVIASRLLTYVSVQNEVKRHMDSAKMSADEVLERLTKVARSDADLRGSDVVKANELLGKFHKLFVDKVETSSTDAQQTVALTFLSRRISKLANKTGNTPEIVELQLQTELADRSDEDYSPDLDATVHPEVWPSGCLIGQNAPEIERIEEIGDQ